MINDLIEVTYTGVVYSTYKVWADKYIPPMFRELWTDGNGHDIRSGDLGIVIAEGLHGLYSPAKNVNLKAIYIFQKNKVFIIESSGIELVENASVPNEIENCSCKCGEHDCDNPLYLLASGGINLCLIIRARGICGGNPVD